MVKQLRFIYLLLLAFLFQSGVVFSAPANEPVKKKRPKIGLVLSGGGAKGFAYLGMLKVFREVGLHIDYIGGTSIGSKVESTTIVCPNLNTSYSTPPLKLYKFFRVDATNTDVLKLLKAKFVCFTAPS